jgi:putative methyltransferase (TIGR04325 family)
MNVSDLIPPILVNYLKKVFRARDFRNYESFELALKASTLDAYQNAELCNMIADKTIVLMEKLKEKPYELSSANTYLLAAINQYVNINSKKSLTILDFGGACGAHYFEIKRFITNNIVIKWYVVETEKMISTAKSMGLANYELSFVSSPLEIVEKIDFIYSSCTLHYVPEPYETARILTGLNADWVFFNRMMFNENDRDFITVQKSLFSDNGPGRLPKGYSDKIISYPHTTLSLQKFISFMQVNNYKIEWVCAEKSGCYPIGNERIVGKGLLFVRSY